ncbi:hypothetical protein C6370_01605 [Bacillus atrophaeus]|uniref:Uncharacterized protein n=1 Tax=Bacillus atrophaeus (strain 1942) TaxID=720555 RepID=A0ABN3Z8M0_BACA1|nr:hypothetical protein BATR1942_06095 [Bacillus atrophaeus 1942]ASS71132.1 hypothetical protein BaGK_09225 [Bacillus atrophaeus]EIM08866.1 hypothetical protein UY9_20514 [Bacillus atrophaeus C89]ATO29126.1 hypothetical protein RA13_14880 [Bacillus atrophaeus]KAA6452407.1 hypothetical protein DX926_08645 [Bacillus atrophaeus]
MHIHLHKKYGYGIVLLEMLTITEAKSGETRSFVLNRQFCLDMFIVFFLAPALLKQGFYAEKMR